MQTQLPSRSPLILASVPHCHRRQHGSINSSVLFGRLLDEKDRPHVSVCADGQEFFERLHWTPASSSPFIFESNLGIEEWLLGATIVNNLLSSSGGGGGGSTKPDTISYEIKFVIVSSGNITPTWKLLKVSANTTGNFFSTGRTRTHDLIITIGPSTGPSAQSARDTHLASQIGNAVATANRSLLAAPP